MPNIGKILLIALSAVGIAALVVAFALPFVWMVSTSLKSFPETVIFPPKWIPKHLMWGNFVQAWQSGPFLNYFMNSIMVAIGILIMQLTTITLAAYAYARYRFKGANALFGITMLTLMIPSQLIFLPVYLLMSKWGMLNTLASLILPFSSSAFGIFLLRQSFKQVQDELLDAARLDDATEWKIIYKIMIPMARPTFITFALFSFIAHWNDYFWPLVMTTTDAVRTLPIGVARLIGVEGATSWHILMAGNMIMVVPMLIVFFIAQRQIIKAFVYSGIK